MDYRIDTQTINRSADLLALAGTHLKRAASTGGGEWKGPCPFCGGSDRFSVQPAQGRWLCRQCTGGKWEDSISLGRRLWPGLPFRAVCERLAGGSLPTRSGPAQRAQPEPAYAPPSLDWQTLAQTVAVEGAACLWQPEGARALAYLRNRGLRDETIRHFGLGFNPQGRRVADLWLDRGITIPCKAAGALWYVKVRRAAGAPKYRCLAGSKPAALFNGDELIGAPIALFVEGEFDCMLAWQEAGDLLPAATLGGATNTPDLATWGRYFLAPDKTLILPDNDAAGDKGAETVVRHSRCPILVALPDAAHKDVTDFYQAGGDLRAWANDLLIFHDPQPGSALETALALGGVIVET